MEKSESVGELLAEDHEALDKLLRALLAALDRDDAATAFAHLDLFWARLAMHIRAENLHLFPAILKALDYNPGEQENKIPSPTEAREAIAKLRRDHNFFMHELANAVKVVGELVATSWSKAESEPLYDIRQSIGVVTKRLESHNKLEEKLVYSLPARLLTPEDQLALMERTRRELRNLPPRFSNTPSNQQGSIGEI